MTTMAKTEEQKLLDKLDALAKERNHLAELKDGLEMRVNSMDAKINAQIKRIELLETGIKNSHVKLEAYKEMLWEVLGIYDFEVKRAKSE
ncbi:unnamed protein product [Sphagnum balticum]